MVYSKEFIGRGLTLKDIYLDNASTTKPCKESVDKIIEMLKENYGNPSSLHGKGISAELEMEKARNIISNEINAQSNEIYFTSGGTESNNIAIFGATRAKKKSGNKIVTTAIEHSSVYNAMQELEKEGYEVIYLKPDKNGNITKDQISNSIDEKTILISIMMVNNEVGSILPVEKIKSIIKEKNSKALLHIDAVQAFGKLPIDVLKIGADLMSISGHKVYGPKGVGALYKKRGIKIIPLVYAGGQEKKVRPGTEPLPLICGFGSAVEQFKIKENYSKVSALNQHLRKKLSEIEGITINSGDDAVPYIINFSTNKIKSETMLHYLSSKGIYVSSGSACAKGQKSRVLGEIKLGSKAIDTAIRVSLSKDNTSKDIDELIKNVKLAINSLAHR